LRAIGTDAQGSHGSENESDRAAARHLSLILSFLVVVGTQSRS